MKPETRNGGAHIDTDIPQPTDFDDILDTSLFYFEWVAFAASAFMLAMAVVSVFIHVGVI